MFGADDVHVLILVRGDARRLTERGMRAAVADRVRRRTCGTTLAGTRFAVGTLIAAWAADGIGANIRRGVANSARRCVACRGVRLRLCEPGTSMVDSTYRYAALQARRTPDAHRVRCPHDQ